VKAFPKRGRVKPAAQRGRKAPHKWLGAYKAGNGFQTPHEHKQ